MASESKDFRTPTERLADFVDSQLFDFYHEAGLVEAAKDAVYSHDDVLRFLRAAYWRGVVDQSHDRGEIARVAAEHAADLRKGDQPASGTGRGTQDLH